MKIVLLQDVAGQGKKGEVKTVSEGYARNFLFPRNLAKEATAEAMREIEAKKASVAKKEEQAKKAALDLAAKLNNFRVTIKVKAGEAGRVFGAVTSKQVAEALADAGYQIDKKKVVLPDVIRTLGTTSVVIKLHHDISAQIQVHVVADH